MLRAIVINTTHTSLASTRLDPLLLATAVLGRGWRLCSLLAYERQNVSIGPVLPLTAAGDSPFGFPAAVVVYSELGRQEAR